MRLIVRLCALCFVVAPALLVADEPNISNRPVDAPTPQIPAKSVEQLAADARQSVVVVSYKDRDGRQAGVGSGFVISADGLIATNLHVIGDARPISVQTADGKSFDVVSVHATDRVADLAILRIDDKSLPPLTLGNSDTIKQGEPIVALGNPRGLKHSVVAGVLSGTQEIDEKTMLQLAIPIEPGNSGGPVLDAQGRVIGIVTLKSLVTNNLGFAVPINALKPLIEKPNPVPMSRWLTIGALNAKEWTPLFGAQWKQRAGRIRVEGRGKGIGARSIALSTSKTPELPFEVAVKVRMDQADGAAGLVFHSNGDEKHYGFYPSNGGLRLSRFDGADVFQWKVLEEVRSRHYRPGEWNTLKVRLDKDKIQCFVNDELVIESKDSQFLAGRVGLAKFRHTTAEFKRFQVAKQIRPSRPDAAVVKQITAIVDGISAARPPKQALVAQVLPHADSSGDVLRQRARQLEQQARRLRQLADAVHQESVRRQLATELKKDEDQIDLIRGALLIAAIDNEEVDVEAYVRQIQRMAGELKDGLDKQANEPARLAALNKYLFDESGFHGSRTNYYHQSNSYMNEVIDDREGLPIMLSVLYMDMARRIELKVVGVGLPGHFVVRHEPTKGKTQLIDPFDRGRVWTDKEAEQQVKSRIPGPLDKKFLEPQPKLAILIRMLRNLMGVAGAKEDAEALLSYIETVLVIDPESAEDRWFRAVLRFQTGRIDEAIEDTNWLLKERPDGVDLQRVRQLLGVLQRTSEEE
jgi:S1-C subfamily serine protease/regulator of sirC expression with transglutaminase-like and TPR domain